MNKILKVSAGIAAATTLLAGCATVRPAAIPHVAKVDPYVCNRVYILSGVSMTGLIDNGTTIIVDTCYPFENLKPGDAVTFLSDDRNGSTTHIIYDGDPKHGFRTWGVHNGHIDPKVMTRREYIGKVAYIFD